MRLTVDDQGWKKVLLLKDGRFHVAVYEAIEHAERAAALWNAAEELNLTTEKIAEGEIQKTFGLAESRAGVIEAALERIESLEKGKGEIVNILEKILVDYTTGKGEYNLAYALAAQSIVKKARGEG